MQVDNFNQIKELFFNEDLWKDNFYLVQILLRKKDLLNTKYADLKFSNNIMLKSFIIKSRQELEDKENLIKYLCDTTKWRAYITTNMYSLEQTSHKMLKRIFDLIENKWFDWLKWSFQHAVIKSKNIIKRWLIDLDIKDTLDIEYVYFKNYLMKNNIYLWEIETINWIHLISKPFDLQKYYIELKEQLKNNKINNEEYEKLLNTHIHKDNSTILYA